MPRRSQAILSRPLVDADPQFARDVVAGLTARPKTLPPKYFYDEAGAQLFEAITATPEYYPTRCEMEILHERAAEIGKYVPQGCALIEFGSGSSRKARLVLAAGSGITAYVPVDLSAKMLADQAQTLQRDWPHLRVIPVEADFSQPFTLPPELAALPRAGFFPGSTIGNFEPHEACAFMRHAGRMLGPDAILIIGVDLIKDVDILNAAYGDAAGITAQFNLNLLTRINRELGANFDLTTFSHHAFYNSERLRIEMHLASKKRQKVRVAGRVIEFRLGETIHTENSYKYSLESFSALARGSGWTPLSIWTDAGGSFSVHVLRFEEG